MSTSETVAETKTPEAGDTTPAPETNPIEDQAREMGWRPKEEYEGEAPWVNAEIFVARAPLFDKIEQQRNEVREVKKALEALKSHHAKTAENEYKRALKHLQEQRKDALENDDFRSAEMIRDQIDELKQNPPKTELPSDGVPPEFQAWVDKNTWYNDDEDMKDFADARGNKLSQKGLAPNEVLKQVEEAVKKAFPEKFKKTNPNRDRPSGVEGDSAPGKASPSSGSFKLTAEEEKVCATFVRQGIMSREDYIKEIKKNRG